MLVSALQHQLIVVLLLNLLHGGIGACLLVVNVVVLFFQLMLFLISFVERILITIQIRFRNVTYLEGL